MTGVAAAALAGYLVAWLAWRSVRPLFAHPPLAAENYRGRVVATAAGVLLPVAAVVVEAGRALAETLDWVNTGAIRPRLLVLLAALGFGILGVIDDVAGSSADRGFRGHLAALARGRLTSGAVKLVGGAAVAVIVVAPVDGDSVVRLLTDAALVALAANLGNLLDRRPGRVIKAGAVGFVVMVLAAAAPAVLDGAAVVVGAAVGLLVDDLRERLMLGDAGANVLGAVLGLGVVVAFSPGVRLAVLAGVAGLNLLGEVVSFSRVIDAVPPLRLLDRAGRRL